MMVTPFTANDYGARTTTTPCNIMTSHVKTSITAIMTAKEGSPFLLTAAITGFLDRQIKSREVVADVHNSHQNMPLI